MTQRCVPKWLSRSRRCCAARFVLPPLVTPQRAAGCLRRSLPAALPSSHGQLASGPHPSLLAPSSTGKPSPTFSAPQKVVRAATTTLVNIRYSPITTPSGRVDVQRPLGCGRPESAAPAPDAPRAGHGICRFLLSSRPTGQPRGCRGCAACVGGLRTREQGINKSLLTVRGRGGQGRLSGCGARDIEWQVRVDGYCTHS